MTPDPGPCLWARELRSFLPHGIRETGEPLVVCLYFVILCVKVGFPAPSSGHGHRQGTHAKLARVAELPNRPSSSSLVWGHSFPEGFLEEGDEVLFASLGHRV